MFRYIAYLLIVSFFISCAPKAVIEQPGERAQILEDIEEYRKKYYANNINQVTIIDNFKYRYLNNPIAADIITKLAYDHDEFALNFPYLLLMNDINDESQVHEFMFELSKGGGSYAQRLANAAAGVTLSGIDEYKEMALDLNIPYIQTFYGDIDDIREAAHGGYYFAYVHLFRRYYRGAQIEDICVLAKNAYERFGLEVILAPTHKDMYELHKKCAVFGDKLYTLEDMGNAVFLKDIKTEESDFVQATIAYGHGDYEKAMKAFENLSANGSLKFSANASYYLSSMYYHGIGVDIDKKIASAYAEKAYNSGHSMASRYLSDKSLRFVLPKTLELCDYGIW